MGSISISAVSRIYKCKCEGPDFFPSAFLYFIISLRMFTPQNSFITTSSDKPVTVSSVLILNKCLTSWYFFLPAQGLLSPEMSLAVHSQEQDQKKVEESHKKKKESRSKSKRSATQHFPLCLHLNTFKKLPQIFSCMNTFSTLPGVCRVKSYG